MTCLYRRLLGARFEDMPALVRELHDLHGAAVWSGRVDVTRGPSAVCRAIASLFGLPPEGCDQPIRVIFETHGRHEIWRREFGHAVFRSVQSCGAGLLKERVGPSLLLLQPVASADGLTLTLHGMRLLGIPIPRHLRPAVCTLETESGGKYRFRIEAHLPLFGLLISYAGWLTNSAPVENAAI
jgi:hypothetical protein